MEFYKKNTLLGKGTKYGIKLDKKALTIAGSMAGLVYSNIKRDQDLKDAASSYILKSVDYNRKAEETNDPQKKAEYEKKSKEYEQKAIDITSLINKRKEVLKSKDFTKKAKEIEERVNEAYNNGIISDEERDTLLEYADESNYYFKEELELEL